MNKRVMSLAIVGHLLLANICVPLHGMQDLNTSDIPNFSSKNLFYLMYMDMGKGFIGEQIGNNNVMKSGALSQWYNRVCTGGDDLSNQNIDAVLKYLDGAPFGWWVSTEQPGVGEALKAKGFIADLSEPAMIVNLAMYDFKNQIKKHTNERLIWKSISTVEDFNIWIKTSAKGFGIDFKIQQDFVNFIKKHADLSRCFFYLGLIDGTPASTGLMIEHKPTNIASLHIVSTIPEYRKQGLATMLSIVAMIQAANDDCDSMILLSSPMAHPLFKELGFTNYKEYRIYTGTTEIPETMTIETTETPENNGNSWCSVM